MRGERWGVAKRRDEISDEVYYNVVRTSSSAGASRSAAETGALITLSLTAAGTPVRLVITAPARVIDCRSTIQECYILYRVDGNEPKVLGAVRDSEQRFDKVSTDISPGSDGVDFLAAIKHGSRLLVELPIYGEGPELFRFDVSGLEDALKNRDEQATEFSAL
jgi:hypothetical protein